MTTVNKTAEQKAKLVWRCRRGMLELDLILTRFLETHWDALSTEEQAVFERMLHSPDPDLYAWFMGYETVEDTDFKHMVTLSNVTVRLKHSRDYVCLLVLVHAFAVIALFQTACPPGLIIALGCVLAAHGSYLWRKKTPGACCSELSYAKERWWVLDDSSGELVTYSEAQVRFDFGWLMWVVFKEEASLFEKKRQQDVLVFHDQISPDEHRLLRLILRVRDTSHKNSYKHKSKKT